MNEAACVVALWRMFLKNYKIRLIANLISYTTWASCSFYCHQITHTFEMLIKNKTYWKYKYEFITVFNTIYTKYIRTRCGNIKKIDCGRRGWGYTEVRVHDADGVRKDWFNLYFEKIMLCIHSKFTILESLTFQYLEHLDLLKSAFMLCSCECMYLLLVWWWTGDLPGVQNPAFPTGTIRFKTMDTRNIKVINHSTMV